MPTTYSDQVVRLADLTVTRDVIADAVFSNVEIVGPGVVVLIEDVNIKSCSFDAPGPDALFWPIDDERGEVTGAIGLQRVTFESCQFRRVGLAVRRSEIDAVKAGFGLG